MKLSDLHERRLAEMRRVFGTGNAFTARDAAKALKITVSAARNTLGVLRRHGLVKCGKELINGKITCVYSFDSLPATPYRAQTAAKPKAKPEPRQYFVGTVTTKTETGYTVSEVWRTYGTYKTEIRPVAAVRGMRQAERLADSLSGKYPPSQKARGKADPPREYFNERQK